MLLRMCLSLSLSSVLFLSLYRYMKGRLTVDKVNQGVDEIHSILTVKYKILATPLIKLTGDLLGKYKVRTISISV